MKRKFKLLALVGAFCALGVGVAAAASSPTVSTGGVQKVKQHSAIVFGRVNPNGATTAYGFKYGLTTAYGDGTHGRTLRPGTKPVSVHDLLSNLLPGTIYHYQLVAFNKFGQSVGRDHSFKTAGNPPPGAATGPAADVTTNSAVLTGIVTTNNQATTYRFQLGTTTSYGLNTPVATAPASKTPTAVDQQVSGLLPSGTWIHYRLVAVNRGVAEYGADQTFFTEPNPAPKAQVKAKTRPRRDKHRPYVFTTTGTIDHPSSIPSQYACTQSVMIKFRIGHRVSQRTPAPVQANCTFSAQTVFNHLPRHGRKHHRVKMWITVYYSGSGYLAAAGAKKEHVTLG